MLLFRLTHIFKVISLVDAATLSVQNVVKAGVQNYLIVAIDEKLRDYLVSKGYNVYYRDIMVSSCVTPLQVFQKQHPSQCS